MAIRITADTMTLKTGDRVAATGNGAWIISTRPSLVRALSQLAHSLLSGVLCAVDGCRSALQDEPGGVGPRWLMPTPRS
jgi:hypothetical protein